MVAAGGCQVPRLLNLELLPPILTPQICKTPAQDRHDLHAVRGLRTAWPTVLPLSALGQLRVLPGWTGSAMQQPDRRRPLRVLRPHRRAVLPTLPHPRSLLQCGQRVQCWCVRAMWRARGAVLQLFNKRRTMPEWGYAKMQQRHRQRLLHLLRRLGRALLSEFFREQSYV